jgi:hypothetical protein
LKTYQQPFWSDPKTIHHPLDSDIVDSMLKGNEKCSSLMMMDPSYEPKTNQYHIKWTDEDVELLMEGMVARAMGILRYAKPENSVFKEELWWIHSPQFAEIAALMGVDAAEVRRSTVESMRLYRKKTQVSLKSEFAHWREVFSIEFKELIGVKVNTLDPNGFNTLKSLVANHYELAAMLKTIGEYMDDLYLEGHDRKVLVKQLLISINSK